jgi:folate-dependent phosphoribosylglycinamide formyltransferase PurN
MSAPLERPLRVVLFGGTYLDPPALRFAVLLDEHPAIELVEVLCQAEGAGWRFRVTELLRRRRLFALPVLAREMAGTIGRWLHAPRASLALRAAARRVAIKTRTVPDVHAPDVLSRLRALAPDAGAIYGAPILRPELFEIPTLGTLGIHHGRVPEYRGKKTTFWEIYNGERAAGVTIQRVNAGIDSGDVVARGEVPIGRKRYGRVERETQTLGFALFVAALLELRDGRARFEPQPPRQRAGRHYRQPSAADFLRFWLRAAARYCGWRRT